MLIHIAYSIRPNADSDAKEFTSPECINFRAPPAYGPHLEVPQVLPKYSSIYSSSNHSLSFFLILCKKCDYRNALP